MKIKKIKRNENENSLLACLQSTSVPDALVKKCRNGSQIYQ
jgi:hypothetical protein